MKRVILSGSQTLLSGHAASASAQLQWPAWCWRMLQDGSCWNMKGMSLLKPATQDPGRRRETQRHCTAQAAGCPHPQASQFDLCWLGRHRARCPAPAALGPALVAPRMGFSVGSSQRQLCGSSAYGGNPTPPLPAWLQCPRSPSETCCLSFPPSACSILPCFCGCLFCVCVSAGESGGKLGTMSIPLVSALDVTSPGCPAWRCSAVVRVCQPGASAESCCLLQKWCCPSKPQPA